eukprot:234192-Prymnesium_polylepis.1
MRWRTQRARPSPPPAAPTRVRALGAPAVGGHIVCCAACRSSHVRPPGACLVVLRFGLLSARERTDRRGARVAGPLEVVRNVEAHLHGRPMEPMRP